MTWELLHADCRDVMANMGDATVDAVVCDPPYHLTSIVKRFGSPNAAPVNNAGTRAGNGADPYARAARGFMGQTWDGGDIAFDPELWAECLRVLKPGGHLIAFSGSRTYHRMAYAIDVAGFEIRDQLLWLYGSGFPKSQNIALALDKKAGAIGPRGQRFNAAGDGEKSNGGSALRSDHPDYKPPEYVTPEAQQWAGWGTALKPAHEPMVLARKPLDGTVAENVLRWGVGGLNIDGCRVGTDDTRSPASRTALGLLNDDGWQARPVVAGSACGRFPANVLHDGSEAVLAGFPKTGPSTGGGKRNGDKFGGGYAPSGADTIGFGDSGSAARFFYCAKASKRDRSEGLDAPNPHPTVKPTDLMRWLVRLVTPPGGLVFDPFTGSGSTGKAAMLEGFRFIGAEMTAEYVPVARARIAFGAASRAALTNGSN